MDVFGGYLRCILSIEVRLNPSKTSINQRSKRITGKPFNKAYLEFMTTYRYKNVDDERKLPPNPPVKGRGRPDEHTFYIPSNDDLAFFLGIVRNRSAICDFECKNTKELGIELEKLHVIELDGNQETCGELAARLSVSKTTIHNWHIKAGIEAETHIEYIELDENLAKYAIRANKYGMLRGGIAFGTGNCLHPYPVTKKGYEEVVESATVFDEPIYLCVREANSYSLPNGTDSIDVNELNGLFGTADQYEQMTLVDVEAL